jgi:tetratricopeptide (TPR) repeat protein
MLRKILSGMLFVVLTAVAVSLSPRLLPAQASSVEGEVKGVDGQLLVGVEVDLDRKEIKQHYQTKTDKKGHYFHTGLSGGTYRISIKQDGKEIAFHENVRIPVGDTTKHDFDLKADQEAIQKAIPKEVKEQMEKQQAEVKKQGDLKKHFDQGTTLFANQQYDQALTEFQAAVAADPSHPSIYIVYGRLAETYERLKNYDDAATYYQKAITAVAPQAETKPDLKQNLAGYYNNYAGILANQKKSKEAMDAYNKAVELNPTSAGMVYFNMGAVLTNTHAPLEDRIAAFKKATEADPKSANAWYQYGLTLSEKMTVNKDGSISAPPEMIAAMHKYLELDPNGKFVEAANGLIAAAGQTVETSYGTKKDTKKGKK